MHGRSCLERSRLVVPGVRSPYLDGSVRRLRGLDRPLPGLSVDRTEFLPQSRGGIAVRSLATTSLDGSRIPLAQSCKAQWWGLPRSGLVQYLFCDMERIIWLNRALRIEPFFDLKDFVFSNFL